jgi:polar amino acid transport system substrate-binding protein
MLYYKYQFNKGGLIFLLSYFSRVCIKHISIRTLFLGIIVGLPLLIAACGSTSSGSSSTSAAPKDLITPGTLTVGSDTTYPPQEFIDSTGKATGFDIDLITAMAKRMGLNANIRSANFNTIIDDLSAKRYDVAISALTINNERKQKVDFVPYFNSGESLLVQKGNPQHLQGVNDLCGKAIGVQDGTIEHDDLSAANKATCQAKPIQLTVLKDQTDVIQLLANRRVVATYQDSPVTDYYIKQNPGQFEIGGSIVNASPEGIAVRKGDTSMFTAIQTAFNQVKADGTYDSLFTKWQLNTAQKISLTDDKLHGVL